MCLQKTYADVFQYRMEVLLRKSRVQFVLLHGKTFYIINGAYKVISCSIR